jgi:hypothetical protein
MQSHRTLAGPDEVLQVARMLREKKLPCDALIYLGTGYCPAGWNTGHASVDFNPATFDKPAEMINALHDEHFHVVLHQNAPPRRLTGDAVTRVEDENSEETLSELDAVRQRYAHRSSGSLYSLLQPYPLRIVQEKERALVRWIHECV